MRHLYTAEPKDEALITQAKGYERRRCNHHELEQPLSTLECLSEVVDPKDNLVNKHRYIIATQDPEVRARMRRIPGVPLVYINRSVMILEPMATSTEDQRDREEKAKFRAGLKGKRGGDSGEKRKRDEEDDEAAGTDSNPGVTRHQTAEGDAHQQKKKRVKGPKGPNPLSVKKPAKEKKIRPPQSTQTIDRPATTELQSSEARTEDPPSTGVEIGGHDTTEATAKHKRKRKHKPKTASGSNEKSETELPALA